MLKTLYFIFALFFTQEVLACSCVKFSLSETWRSYETVFIANVSEIEIVEEGGWKIVGDSRVLEHGKVKGSLKVLKTFKGVPSKVTHLQAAHYPMSSDCSITLSKGKYLVVTNKIGSIPISMCSETRRLEFLDYPEQAIFHLKK